MKKSLLFGAGQGPRLAVLERIKRSGKGMGVKELSEDMGMSYMGVKAHCKALITAGYLTTRREPSMKGRPRMLHRLTKSGEELFSLSQEGFSVALLAEAAGLWGEAAPRKLLLKLFRTMGECYRGLLRAGETQSRLQEFLKIRDGEGRMCVLHALSGGAGWELRESHNPMSSLMKHYPEAAAMEECMMSDVLGVSVRRREDGEVPGVVVFACGSSQEIPD